MSSPMIQSEELDDEIDLFELWGILCQQKWLIILCAILCCGAATALAFMMTPKYEATVVVTPTDMGKQGGGAAAALAGQFGGLAEMAGVSLGGAGGAPNLAYLKSRAFFEGFIKKENLMPLLYDKIWDTNAKRWNVSDPEKIPTEWKAYQLFNKNIVSVQEDKKTNLITLTVTWKDREKAVAWANGLVREANADLRAKAIEESSVTLSYLQQELQKTSVVEVQTAIYRLIESQMKTMTLANTKEEFAFKVIDPAKAVDEDAFVKPQRPMMIAIGAVGGLFLGVLLAFLRNAIKQRKQR